MQDGEKRENDDRRIFDRRADPRIGLGLPDRRKGERRTAGDRRKPDDN